MEGQARVAMRPTEPEPLWLQSIPDREPWRRGRDAICFITLFILLGQAVLLAWSIMQGNVPTFFLCVAVDALACFFLYFIWIGRNWPRWIIAPLFACSGFASVIWGITEGNGPVFLTGIGGLVFFSYLAFVPSVYAFARHQRERITLAESLVVALVFLLLLSSVGSGLFGFYYYNSDLEREATGFAAKTFNQVFIYHDEEFLRRNLSDEERVGTPSDFIHRAREEFAEPGRIAGLQSAFSTHLLGWHLMISARFLLKVTWDSGGPVWINIEVSRIGRGWQIDHIGWNYSPEQIE
jgi:hypothetical protein